jgi:hypothetical protein
MFWRVSFLFSSSVYVVLYTAASDTVAFEPLGTLAVRIAAKCFRIALDRSFPLSLLYVKWGNLKWTQNAMCSTRRIQFLMPETSLRNWKSICTKTRGTSFYLLSCGVGVAKHSAGHWEVDAGFQVRATAVIGIWLCLCVTYSKVQNFIICFGARFSQLNSVSFFG